MKPKLCIPDPVLFGHKFPLNIIICGDMYVICGNVAYKLFSWVIFRVPVSQKTNICDLSEGDTPQPNSW